MDSAGRNTELRRTYVLVVRHRNPAVLAVASDDGWRLPVFDSVPTGRTGRAPTGYFESIFCLNVQRLLNDHHSINVPELFMLYKAYEDMAKDCGEKIVEEVEVVEAEGPTTWSSGAIWVTKEKVKSLKLSTSFEPTRQVIENVLHAKSDGSTDLRAPWEKPGWFDKARAWISSTLGAMRDKQIVSINPRKTMPETRVLEVKTEGKVRSEREVFYFKATRPHSTEVQITQWLSSIVPHNTLELVNTDEELNAMLVDSFTLQYREGCVKNRNTYAAVYRAYAKLQL